MPISFWLDTMLSPAVSTVFGLKLASINAATKGGFAAPS
jgi:hypothetical protein